MLTDLLKPELVACHVQASDWEEAIRACGKLLVDAGKCDQSYVDAMISSVHKFGPYMVLEEGIAMPHAQADGNVSEAGICIVTLDPAVAFGHEDFDPVHVLVGICAPDPKAHLGCLAGAFADVRGRGLRCQAQRVRYARAGFGDHAFILLGLNGTAMRRRFWIDGKSVTCRRGRLPCISSPYAETASGPA